MKSEPFKESLRTEANTGGARVVGLQFLGGTAAADLFAMIPQSWESQDGDQATICVRTNSSDGLYDSENTYIVPGDLSEPVTVPHIDKSLHTDRIIQLHPEALGIRITRNECGSEGSDNLNVLARWRDAAPGGNFAIFVNSFDADRLVAYPPVGPGVECEPIRAEISVAFDRRCELTLPANVSRFKVELQPVKNRRKGRIETIVIEVR